MNKALALEIAALRAETSRVHLPDEYIGVWTEKDRLGSKIEDAFVLIFRTYGCFWAQQSGCSMCGYFNDTNAEPVTDIHILTQLKKAQSKYHNEKIVKLYTSGSFLDDHEISEKLQLEILKRFSSAERIIIETRPEFITSKKLEVLAPYKDKLMIAIGLECADDFILENSINKGFKVQDYEKAAMLLKAHNILLKTYILIKPPFLTERQAIDCAVKSAVYAAQYSEYISFNPVNIQAHTLVSQLWHEQQYRTPWLWSVLEILRKTAKLGVVASYPTGGFKFGAHNCKKCNRAVLDQIREFSLTQDPKVLEQEIECDCKKYWQAILEIEYYTFKTIGIEAEYDKFKLR